MLNRLQSFDAVLNLRLQTISATIKEQNVEVRKVRRDAKREIQEVKAGMQELQKVAKDLSEVLSSDV